MKKPKVKESDLQKKIMDYLRLKHKALVFKHRNVGIFKKNTGKYIPLSFGEKGISDIIGCLPPDGKMIAVEVKSNTGVPSKEKVEFLDKVKENGGIAILAYTIDEVIEKLENNKN